MRQILINLFSNAIKFTTIGGIKIEACAENGYLTFAVSDTGAGIKKEDMLTLYNAFEQIDETKVSPANGVGLGLTIAQSLANMMRGKISVESEYGKGSVFTVTIPYILGNLENISAAVQSFSFISAPEAEILVVDDSKVNLNVAVGMLKLCGIKADTADDAPQCYEKIRNKHYDIVFMDHILPGTDGVEATKYLRENGYGDLIIIALTANTAAGARELFASCGMDDFLPKPIDKVQLNDMLRKWLPQHKLRELENADEQSYRTSAVRQETPPDTDLIDSGKAIESLGDRELYFSVLKTYYDETPVKIRDMSKALEDGDINLFTILVHSVKSTSALIGALVPFRQAKAMELAARNGNVDYVNKNYSELLALLNQTLKQVSSMLSSNVQTETAGEAGFADESEIEKPADIDKALLVNLYLACETMESLRIDDALAELRAGCVSPEGESFVRKISELIDDFELKRVMEILLD